MERKKYKMIRIVCSGEFKSCSECENAEFSEGYCKLCKRPLWRKIGEKCNNIIGYLEKPNDGIFKKQGKIHIKCTVCNTMSTL